MNVVLLTGSLILLTVPASLQQIKDVAEGVSGISSIFSINATRSHVIKGLERNVILSCNRTRNANASNVELVSLRIERRTPGGPWKRIADVSGSSRDLTVDRRVVSEGHAEFTGEEGGAHLRVQWPVATNETYGVYRCAMVGLDTDARAVIERSPELEITEKPIPAHIMLHLLLREKDKMARMAKGMKEAIYESSNKSRSLGVEVQDIRKELSEITSVNRHSYSWPRGPFALLKPDTGCPANLRFSKEREGIYVINTESSNSWTSRTSLSRSIHLSEPILQRNGSDNFAYLRFCGTELTASWTLPWPESGSYCINKFGSSCPGGFESGHVLLDEEDEDNLSYRRGPMFTDSDVHFCCKAGDASQAISLPSAKPFYLYRKGGRCQEVSHMSVKEEFINIDTEHSDNHSGLTGVTPDIDIVKSTGAVTVHLCYYS